MTDIYDFKSLVSFYHNVWYDAAVHVDGINNDIKFYGQTLCAPLHCPLSAPPRISIKLNIWVLYEFIEGMLIFYTQTDLSALFTFSFFCPPMNPMMMSSCLLAILTHSDISKRRFARQLRAFHQHGDTTSVSNDFACGTFHPWSMFLLIANGGYAWKDEKKISGKNLFKCNQNVAQTRWIRSDNWNAHQAEWWMLSKVLLRRMEQS